MTAAFVDRPPDRADLARALELTPKYDRPGPRYTSYPPAPHFTDEITGATAREVYQARGKGAPPLSLYAHLPFCEALCTYCGCNVIISRNHTIVERYLAGLAKEITLAADALAGGPLEVVQFHLGGGTPTFFSPAELDRLHGLITARFTLRPDAEQAIEVDPRVTTRAHLETLARLGFRRVSMGIQDFDPEVQKAVHREQTVEETDQLIRDARELGFTSVNVDLMYGLPFQTLNRFQHTLDLVLERLSPDRVAMFGYAHVPWLKSHQRKIEADTLPAANERLGLFQAGVEAFVGAGYEFVGFDHFAKPTDDMAIARKSGDLHRNFMGFHTSAGSDMVAFGITGIGDVSGVYLQNRHQLSTWEHDLEEGRLPVQRGYRRTRDDEVRGTIIQELTCNGRVTVAQLAAAGTPWRTAWVGELERLAPMVEDGLLVIDDHGIRVTPLGRLFVRNVCMVFDAHLGKVPPTAKSPDGPRYSRTV